MLYCVQFYLLDDRLCYTDEPGKVEDVRYIPLDRIPVRALPRGYGPQIGVTVIEDRYSNAPAENLYVLPWRLKPILSCTFGANSSRLHRAVST